MANNRVLAVITARGGSKRIPRKNLRKVGGQTLLGRTVNAALNSKIVDRCILSSDCSEIIDEALDYGCDVPFVRPSELATDKAKSEDVLEHALKNIPGFDWVLLLQPTSPFRTSGDIDSAFEILWQTKRNSCVGVERLGAKSEIKNRYLFRGDVLKVGAEKQLCSFKKHKMPFVLNGAIYIVRASHFSRTKKIVDVDTVGIEMTKKASLDIDTFEDFAAASKLMET